MWRALLALFLLYHELFYNHELFTDQELCVAHTLKNLTTLPDAALLLHPMQHTHFVWQAPLALFLLYRELFSDHELFTDLELCDACTSALPHMTHALGVESNAHSFSIVPLTLFRP